MLKVLITTRKNIWGENKLKGEYKEIDFIYVEQEEITSINNANIDLILIEWFLYSKILTNNTRHHLCQSKIGLLLDEMDCLLLSRKELKTVDGVISINASDTEIIQFIKLIIDGNQVIHNSIKKTLETTTPLTMQEANILHLMSQGLNNREIASSLFISPGTVKSCSSRLYRKLKVKNRTQAVLLYLEIIT